MNIYLLSFVQAGFVTHDYYKQPFHYWQIIRIVSVLLCSLISGQIEAGGPAPLLLFDFSEDKRGEKGPERRRGSGHLVPLLCVSSLICLWGDEHRSSSDGLNILFTSTPLKTQTNMSCVFPLHMRSRVLPPHEHGIWVDLHALNLCDPM